MAMNTIPITVVGNLTADPELRFTPSGAAVANVTVASTPQTFDRQSQEFKDGETTFLRGAVWRGQAENMAESLKRGTQVIVTGHLVTRTWETPEGEKRSVNEVTIDHIGPSLQWATAEVTKTKRGSNKANDAGGADEAPEARSNGGDKAKVTAGAGTGKGADSDLF